MTNKKFKTIAIIMARGGSKGLRGKNVKFLNGKPLIAYSIEDAINSGVCDTVLVTSDDDEIIKISKEFGATVSFKRPAELALDNIPPAVDAMMNTNISGITYNKNITSRNKLNPKKVSKNLNRYINKVESMEDAATIRNIPPLP